MAENDAPELEPCPLCPDGGKPYFTKSVNGSRMAYVGCSQCGLQMKAMMIMITPVDEALSKDIVKIWNTRADPAAPDASELAWDKAVAAAPHTEEAGEVCTPDCQGCNDPIAALIADRNEARELAFRRGQQEKNTKRFLEHFTVKVEPFYEKKHGKLPPQEGALWELLMFVQHELDAVRQARRGRLLRG